MNTHNPANPTTPIESRHTLRTMLLDARAALPGRIAHDAALAHHLAEVLSTLPVKHLATYQPTRGEFDALTMLSHWLAADATRRVLLPVVTDRFSPLQLRRWTPDCEMTLGAYNIPISRSGEMETSDALLVPCIGFDMQRYRTGCGGGSYDHTFTALHAAEHRPRAVGVAHEMNRVGSIAPRSHDIAIDYIVTKRGVS